MAAFSACHILHIKNCKPFSFSSSYQLYLTFSVSTDVFTSNFTELNYLNHPYSISKSFYRINFLFLHYCSQITILFLASLFYFSPFCLFCFFFFFCLFLHLLCFASISPLRAPFSSSTAPLY